jgi:copper resistance protein D
MSGSDRRKVPWPLTSDPAGPRLYNRLFGLRIEPWRGIAFAIPYRVQLGVQAAFRIGIYVVAEEAWFGHSAEGVGLYRASMITVYGIHALATAAWVGGLPPLLFALVEQRRFGPAEARDCTLDVYSRFSLMAMIAVTLVVASGIANAGFRVSGSFGKLFDSGYGDVLLKKLAVVAGMLAVAYFNRYIATPRLRAASPKGVRQITWFRYSVAFDVVLGALVLGVSAILGITMPPQ